MSLILEICSETLSGVRAASMGGAQRIELCSALDYEGLTPSVDLIRDARAATDLELLIMIRPAPGPFLVDNVTLQTMCKQIQHAHTLGVDGFVLGCLLADNEINIQSLQALIAAADGLPITFHRAFDLVPDPIAACDLLIDCGVRHILTSGCAKTALEGSTTLQQLVTHAANRIEIVVGGSVRADNIRHLQQQTGATSFHSALDRNPTVDSVSLLASSLDPDQ